MATFIDMPIGERRKLIAVASNYTNSTSLTQMTLVPMEEDSRVKVEDGSIRFSDTTKILVQYAVQYPITSGTAQAVTLEAQAYEQGQYVGNIRHQFAKSTSVYAQVYTPIVSDHYGVYTFLKGDSISSFRSYYGSSSDKKVTCYVFIYIWE